MKVLEVLGSYRRLFALAICTSVVGVLLREIVVKRIRADAEDVQLLESDLQTQDYMEGGESSMSAALLHFGQDICSELAKGQASFVFSPVSIATALAMVLQAAEGASRRQLLKVLHLQQLWSDAVPESFPSMLDAMNNQTDVQLQVANKAFVSERVAVREGYTQSLRAHFMAEVESVDFENAEAAASKVNSWVTEKTMGLIPEVVAPSTIGADTILLLVNAVYFNASWARPFSQLFTQTAEFHGAGGSTEVPMMYQTGFFRHTSNDQLDFAAVELPYTSGSYSMLILLPGQQDGVPGLLSSLSPEVLNTTLEELRGGSGQLMEQQVQIRLSLPKFEVSFEGSLVQVLKSLGLVSVFGENWDLAGITEAHPTQVNGVDHAAVLRVDEDGTEAAAATSISVGVTSVFTYIDFTVDRPFAFMVLDLTSELKPLFQGAVFDIPAA